MARRRGSGAWTEAQVAELGLGRFMAGMVPRQRSCVQPAWCPVCSAGWTCASNFEDRAQAEACYWDSRGELFADEFPGSRPYGYWMFEAAGVCRHDPRCGLPGRHHDGRRRWLDHHDQLSVRERATLAQWEAVADGA